MKTILLINPPRIHRSNFNDFIVELPIGLLSIAAYLRQSSEVSVSVFDCLIESFEIVESTQFVRYGTPFPEIVKRAISIDPDIIGIGCPFSTQSDICLETAEEIRKSLPDVPIIIGGPHPTVAADKMLEASCCIDICVLGEGERTLRDLVNSYNSEEKSFESLEEVDGIAYRDAKGEVKYTEPRKRIANLDELPYPAYDLVDMDKYLQNDFSLHRPSPYQKSKRVNMLTSRGCPYDCIFCSIHLSMGKKWRGHSPDYVIRHIKFLIENYNVEYIHFEDDNLTFDVERFDQITNLICEKEIKIGWDNQNGMRADSWTHERLSKARESGCTMVNISIESGSQEVLDKVIRKRLKLTDVMQTIELCEEVGLPVVAFFVIGLPGESIEQMRSTLLLSLELYKSYDVASGIMVAVPFYGTRLYNLCVEKNYFSVPLTTENLVNTTIDSPKPIICTPLFGPEDIESLSKWYFQEFDKIRSSKVSGNFPAVEEM